MYHRRPTKGKEGEQCRIGVALKLATALPLPHRRHHFTDPRGAREGAVSSRLEVRDRPLPPAMIGGDGGNLRASDRDAWLPPQGAD